MEEWEEPLHPGPLRDLYPTLPHKATRIAHFLPRMSTRSPRVHRKRAMSRPFAVAAETHVTVVALQARVRSAAMQDVVQIRRHSVRAVCLRVGGGGRPGARRPAAA